MRRVLSGIAAVLTLVAVAVSPAAAAANPYQRGPDPTLASVAAPYGPFATAQAKVPPGNGFNGGYLYHPADTTLGTWGAVAIVPGYSALFADEEAWMGPRLASFGFVVIGIETNSRTDSADARATQLLAALDYLTQRSPVRTRVDGSRLGVIGHSAGGAGALLAALRRPSLKSVVGLAPGSPVGNLDLAGDRVPTMFIAGQRDPVVTPAYLEKLWVTLPAALKKAYVQIAGADHLFATRPNIVEMRTLVPWLKLALDQDTRYGKFLCPTVADATGISMYRVTCPL
ncbi:dienelactone hydrolase family protein [Amycolatopsis tolypomycina]|uniref:dienelactone hydrolase family protein n=1 Tax=Amycolatopsis tolypomycina TaxID=208445 RepID=UPI0033A907BB